MKIGEVIIGKTCFRSQDDNTRGCYSESYLSGCSKVVLPADNNEDDKGLLDKNV